MPETKDNVYYWKKGISAKALDVTDHQGAFGQSSHATSGMNSAIPLQQHAGLIASVGFSKSPVRTSSLQAFVSLLDQTAYRQSLSVIWIQGNSNIDHRQGMLMTTLLIGSQGF